MSHSNCATPSLANSGVSTPDSTVLSPITLPQLPPISKASPPQVRCQVRTRIPTSYGQFYLHVYHSNFDDKEHLALVFGTNITSTTLNQDWPEDNPTRRLVRGAQPHFTPTTSPKPTAAATPQPDPDQPSPPLVRIHSECFTGETVGSVRCDCGQQLDNAMRMMAQQGEGVILYLRQEGRGIGLLNKMRAYNLQDLGYDTVDANLLLGQPADGREYQVGVAMLKDLGISSVRLLTNNPLKMAHLQSAGVEVQGRLSMVPTEWTKPDKLQGDQPLEATTDNHSEVDGYLRTKVLRMGHLLSPPPPTTASS